MLAIKSGRAISGATASISDVSAAAFACQSAASAKWAARTRSLTVAVLGSAMILKDFDPIVSIGELRSFLNTHLKQKK